MVEALCTFHDHYLGFGEPNCNARLMEFFFFRVLFVDLYTVSKIQLYSFATDFFILLQTVHETYGGNIPLDLPW